MGSDDPDDPKAGTPPHAPCLSHEEIDAIVRGVGVPPPEIAAHLARCEPCSAAIALAGFTDRFSRVMSAHPPVGGRDAPTSTMPLVFGYRCLGEVARGGQGVVYRAVQETTGREVAIKVLHPDVSGRSRRARERMAREIEIASLLDHPGIVRIFDSVKLTDGRDALVMELIEGEPLNEWAATRPSMTERERLALLAGIADAAHHAHQLGVIHRDLKPSNILIDQTGRPRLLDFGIARREGACVTDRCLTATGEFAGTMAYAAPEQVLSDAGPADIRTDIYALGVIGYELLTGHLPYPVDGAIRSVIDRVLTNEIPSASRSGLTIDAWTVLAKAMSKDKRRRYQSAADLADDLRSAACGEAVTARADSRWYVMRKTARRHRVPLGLAALVLLGTSATLVALAFGNARLSEALEESRLLQIRAHLAAGSRAQAERVLWHEIARDLHPARDPAAMLWAGSDREKTLMWSFVEMQSLATCLRIEPAAASVRCGLWPLAEGGFVYTRPDLTPVVLDDHGNRAALGVAPLEPRSMNGVRVDPSGRVLVQWDESQLQTTSLQTGRHIASRSIESGPSSLAHAVWGLALAAEGGCIEVASLPGLEPLGTFNDGFPGQTPWLDPHKPILAYITSDARLRVVDLATGRELQPSGFDLMRESRPLVRPQLLLDPERTRVLVAHGRGIRVFDSDAEAQHPVLFEHMGNRVSVGHDALWRTISATAHGDPTLHLWDTRDWHPLRGLPGHSGAVVSHAFSRSGDRIITLDRSGTLRVWQSPAAGWQKAVGHASPGVHQIAVDPRTGSLRTPDDCFSAMHASFDAPSSPASLASGRVAISSDGRWIVLAGTHNVVNMLQPEADPGAVSWTHTTEHSIVGIGFQAATPEPHVAVCLETAAVILLDPRTGDVVQRIDLDTNAIASDLAWSPSGDRGAVSLRDGTIAVFDRSGTTRIIAVAGEQLRAVAVAPNNRIIAAVGDSGRLHLVDAISGRARESARLSEHSLFCVAFHPGGGVAMIGGRDGMVRAVSVSTLEELAAFDAHGSVMSLVFDQDGGRLGVAAIDEAAQLWDFEALVATYPAELSGHR